MSGARITAGSAEQVRVRSIRWNQTGSAGSSDLANVMTYVDGTAYPTTVSSDGKYYTAVFGAGIVIDKGLSKDFYVQADVVGTSAAGRYVQFDIYKATDVAVSGETYGYGITATATSVTGASGDAGSQFTTSGSPFFDGSKITISAGSVTSIQKAVSVAAQNIAVNVPNQVLGGFDMDIKGEPISVQTTKFTIATTSWGTGTQITNIALYGPNGNIVAGPVDESASGTTGQTITFTDTVTFPIGKGTYTLKGKIPSGVSNGATVVVSADASTWSNITGQTTGNTISFTGSFAMNTMTVKSATMNITLSATPAAGTIVAGSQNRTLANYVFDASQSGEDVRFSSVSLKPTQTGNAITNLTTCQLWDGSTALNTGSNVVTTADPMTVNFDSSLTVAKGTVKTLALKCNVSSNATGTYQWGIITGASGTNPSVTGVTSAASVAVTPASGSAANAAAQLISSTGATLAVSQHPSSPTYAVVASGSTGNVVGIMNLRATNEAVNLNKIGLTLTGNLGDIGTVSVWDGGTQIGTATFTADSGTATTTFATPLALAKDTDKQLTIKADFGAIGTNLSGTPGRLVKVDYNSAQGTGVDSGLTVEGSGSTGFAGARLQKTFPVITYSTTGGTAQNGTNDLLVLNVQANSSGDVMLNKLSFSIATTTVTNLASANFTLTGPNGNVGSSTPILAGIGTSLVAYFDSNTNTNDRTIGAGTTKSYTLRYTNLALTGTNSTGAVSTGLLADTAYPTLAGSYLMASTTVSGLSAQNILWSPISTTSIANASTTYNDWTNGYGLGGCFASSGLGQNCTARTIAK
jgi:hypothetical protein